MHAYIRNVGKIVWNTDDNNSWEFAQKLKVTAFKKVNGEDMYILQGVDDLDLVEEVDPDGLCDSYMLFPPPHVLNRWERYQSQQIAEGVWIAKADEDLRQEVSQIL
jgi:hypothetical protein